MILKEINDLLNNIFKKNLALEGDNVGLQIGRLNWDIKTILITLDVTDSVVDEAIESGANLILSHHPFIHEPPGIITDIDAFGKKIIKLFENRIAIYVAHTNYDVISDGLNAMVAEKMELKNVLIIEPGGQQWYKFVIFVPKEAETKMREVICASGGGRWKDYSCCTFNIEGKGTFKPLEGAHPYLGKTGELNFVEEVRIECIVNEDNLADLVRSAIEAHPYEEPAYDIYKIENKFENCGIGRLGELETPEKLKSLLDKIKTTFNIGNFKWLAQNTVNIDEKLIKKVAIINGSANSLTDRISLSDFECDLVIVGELRYHNALKIVENGKILIELGHGESEKPAMKGMYIKMKNYFDSYFAGPRVREKIKLIKSSIGFEPWRYYIE
jgi:dinuclear metal center YbgI/SA1388 family protein